MSVPHERRQHAPRRDDELIRDDGAAIGTAITGPTKARNQTSGPLSLTAACGRDRNERSMMRSRRPTGAITSAPVRRRPATPMSPRCRRAASTPRRDDKRRRHHRDRRGASVFCSDAAIMPATTSADSSTRRSAGTHEASHQNCRGGDGRQSHEREPRAKQTLYIAKWSPQLCWSQRSITKRLLRHYRGLKDGPMSCPGTCSAQYRGSCYKVGMRGRLPCLTPGGARRVSGVRFDWRHARRGSRAYARHARDSPIWAFFGNDEPN